MEDAAAGIAGSVTARGGSWASLAHAQHLQQQNCKQVETVDVFM